MFVTRKPILDLPLWHADVLSCGLGPLAEHRGLVARERGAFIELRLDLPIKLAAGPAATECLRLVENLSVRVLDRQQPDVVRRVGGAKGGAAKLT